jgi:catechol 2,3-dioxygenase-like lactoylglutathione lyase family enzyme
MSGGTLDTFRQEDMMALVTGIGGIFLKVADPAATAQWYRDMLGLEIGDYGATLGFAGAGEDAYAVFSLFKADTNYLDPSPHPAMINLRVDDLDALVAALRVRNVEVLGTEDESYGKFAWILDPNGFKIELWQQIGPAPE